MTLMPPTAPRHPVTREFHGRTFTDDYEWMRDKESPETLAHLEAENAYTKQQTADLEDLTEEVYSEIRSRIKETDMSVPQRAGDWWYYGRTIEGKDYGLSCRIPVSEGQDPWVAPVIPEEGRPEGEQILLDLNELAEGHEFFSLGASSVTTSGRFLAYSVDTTGDERFTLRIRTCRPVNCSPMSEGIYYGATGGEAPVLPACDVDAARQFRHRIGTDPAEDVCVTAGMTSSSSPAWHHPLREVVVIEVLRSPPEPAS